MPKHLFTLCVNGERHNCPVRRPPERALGARVTVPAVGIAFSAKRKNAQAETLSDILFTKMNVD